MDNELLRSFFGDRLTGWNLSEGNDPGFVSDICDFVKALASHGITGTRVTVDSVDIFSHAGIRATIDNFRQLHPQAPLPLESIAIFRQVGSESADADLARIHTELHTAKDEMARFSQTFGIKLSLTIYAGGFAPEPATRIGELMDEVGLESTTFIFTFPDITVEAAAGLRSAVAAFLETPISNNPGVFLSNFPLCFAPPSKFKMLCRFSLGELRSLIRSQRETIKEILLQKHTFLSPCQACRSRAFCYALTGISDQPGYEALLSPAPGDAVAFVGGSLPKADYPAQDNLVYTSPAEQGDILAAILAGFRTLLIIDGFFYSRFPCTTFEVMTALEAGLNVFGASSIGALRAVELDNYGMTGLGYVYDYLKKQRISPYHIVAQTYNEDNSALTIPLVDIIYFLDTAVSVRVLTQDESQACLAVAETISFPLLSFAYVMRRLRETKPIDGAALQRLEEFLARHSAGQFSIKKKDALQLLTQYRQVLSQRDAGHTLDVFNATRKRVLTLLYTKYRGDADLSLPANWQELRPERLAGATVQRDRRDLSPAQTSALAEEFFRDLGVILSDTTGYDPPAGSFIINAFFIPFYFLGYPLSSATGNGDVYDEALASAYMELVERIPTHEFHLATIPAAALDRPPFPLEQLPQHYNLCSDPATKTKIVNDHGWVQATDILSGEHVMIPAFAVMSMYSGSDGNASGNSYAEAILYGIYEIVERDTNQIYLRDAGCEELRAGLRVDPAAIQDDRCQALLGHLSEKGYRVVLYYLVNMFGLPCIRCRVFDTNRSIECHGSTAVRADFNSAVYAALHEAYMQHISYFAGIRDDYRSFLSLRAARMAYRQARSTLFGPAPAFLKTAFPSSPFPSLRAELNHVIKGLASAGIRHILVANTSPMDKYIIKSVKVIIPGTELWFVPDYQPSNFIGERTARTRLMIENFLGQHLDK